MNKLINIKQKTMDPLTEQENILDANANICFICEKSYGNYKKHMIILKKHMLN